MRSGQKVNTKRARNRIRPVRIYGRPLKRASQGHRAYRALRRPAFVLPTRLSTFMSDLLSVPAIVPATSPLSRRGFFGRLGVGAAAVAFIAGCDDEDPDPTPGAVVLDFSNDFGVLNYAYALEQLEYAFYQQVTLGGYFLGLAAASEERMILQDLRDHELAHVDFFEAALGTNAIDALEVDFSAIDFDDRTSVLTTARTFEDLGVSAYNGAGRYFSNTDTGRTFLTIAGKIVSVEARHAAAIRDLLAPGTTAFAGDDVVDETTGLDVIARPPEVLNAQNAGAFIVTPVEITGLPT